MGHSYNVATHLAQAISHTTHWSQNIDLMHTLTKYTTLILLCINPLCISCSRDIDMECPRGFSISYTDAPSLRNSLLPSTCSTSTASQTSPAYSDIEMGCLQPQGNITPSSSQCTDASSTASPLMSDKSAFDLI